MGFGGELNKDIEYYAHHRENTVKWFKINRKTFPWVFTLGFVVPVATYFITKEVQVSLPTLVRSKRTLRSEKTILKERRQTKILTCNKIINLFDAYILFVLLVRMTSERDCSFIAWSDF
jgi:hypothetical protein